MTEVDKHTNIVDSKGEVIGLGLTDKAAKQLPVGIPREVKSYRCTNAKHLKNLVGAPSTVHEDFYANGCSSLVSLLGAPSYVGGKFVITNCTDLTSLEGGPAEVHVLDAQDCPMLTSLKGGPKKAYALWLSRSGIESLEGCPRGLVHLDVTGCVNLKNLKGGPETVNGLKLYMSGITSFEGAPTMILADIDAGACEKLVSLHGLPEILHGDLYLHDCKALTSLAGGPISVNGNVKLNGTGLTSLEGIGTKWFKTISGTLDLNGLKIKSHALGLLLVKGLKDVIHVDADFPGGDIIAKHMHAIDDSANTNDLIECQHELIEKGFAQL